MHIVGTGFGDGVDKAGVGATNFGSGPAANHLEFADGRLGEEEGGLVATALISLEAIVEVSAVDGDIAVDRALPGEDEASAIGFLHDAGGELDEFDEVATAHRQGVDSLFGNTGGGGGLLGVDRSGGGGDGDGFGRTFQLQLEFDIGGFTDDQAEALQFGDTKACSFGFEPV